MAIDHDTIPFKLIFPLYYTRFPNTTRINGKPASKFLRTKRGLRRRGGRPCPPAEPKHSNHDKPARKFLRTRRGATS